MLKKTWSGGVSGEKWRGEGLEKIGFFDIVMLTVCGVNVFVVTFQVQYSSYVTLLLALAFVIYDSVVTTILVTL